MAKHSEIDRGDELGVQDVQAKRPRRKMMVRQASEDLSGIKPTPRDDVVLEALHRYGPLTTDHIALLAFSSIKNEKTRKNKCRDRLRRLFDHGYVERDQIPRKDWEPRKPLIYFLDRKGAEYLASKQGLNVREFGWRLGDMDYKPLTLKHTLAVTDFMIKLQIAAESQGLKIARVISEREFKRAGTELKPKVAFETSRGHESSGYLEPDQYFCLENAQGGKAHFFVEIDLNTETLEYRKYGAKTERYKRRDISRKIRLYNAFQATGLYADLYDAKTFRVLFVTTSKIRANNMKTVAENAGSGNNFYFTIFDDIDPESLLDKPIWLVSSQEGEASLL